MKAACSGVRILPAFELGLPLLGKGGAQFDQVALGAVLAQSGREALLSADGTGRI